MTRQMAGRAWLETLTAPIRDPVMASERRVRRFSVLSIDLETQLVAVGGVEKRLSRAEFVILELMTRRPGVPFTRAQLLDAMFGEGEGDYSDRTVDSHIKRIRKQGIPGIVTYYGAGYLWEDRIVPTERDGRRSHGFRDATPRKCPHCGGPV